MSISDGRTFPWFPFGRAIKPYAFACAFVTTVASIFILLPGELGVGLDGLPALFVGGVGIVTTAYLFYGYWARHAGSLTTGLLLSTGFWAAVTTLIYGVAGPLNIVTWMSLGWVLASGGAWYLEAFDRRTRAR